MTSPGSLSLEQEFRLKALKTEVGLLTLEQAQDFVLEMARQMMIKDNLVRHMARAAMVDGFGIILKDDCNGGRKAS